MRIGIPMETRAGETRVAATPETVKKMLAAGHAVMVQQGAGAGASIPDADYQAAGATLVSAADVYAQAEIMLRVKAPTGDELAKLAAKTVLIGLLSPFQADLVAAYA
ncbi:MAG: NAD(P)(+) transhydrogenase (Re/Si-specific) subunit alpha, partial [Betaproteobacteria bacterium]|nr:NAD(P)(+) transhydrogenase (Re/Si-specific) subunit alpha [Betaproteobacteria bacterium]